MLEVSTDPSIVEFAENWHPLQKEEKSVPEETTTEKSTLTSSPKIPNTEKHSLEKPVSSSLEKPTLSNQPEDEWNKPPAHLQALAEVIIPKKENQSYSSETNMTEEVRKEINNQFANNDIETDSEAAKFLTDLTEKMIAGTEVAKTRVFIIKKGKTVNAFAYPDGTIFITQELLNRLDTIDQIAAVLAHEVGHLIDKTTISAYQAGSNHNGVGWVHETASDLISASLLEKLNLNSNAFMSAIQQIELADEKQNSIRGDVVHQASQVRAVEFKLATNKIDSSTSHIPETPKNKYDFLQTQEILFTNLELFDQAYEKEDLSSLLNIIDKMSAIDISNLTSHIYELWRKRVQEVKNAWREKNRDEIASDTNKEQENLLQDKKIKLLEEVQASVYNLLKSRLSEETGATANQAQSLLLLNQYYTESQLSPLSQFQNFDQAITSIDNLSFWNDYFINPDHPQLSDRLAQLFEQNKSAHKNEDWLNSKDDIINAKNSVFSTCLKNSEIYSLSTEDTVKGKFFITPDQFVQFYDKLAPYLEQGSGKNEISQAARQYLLTYTRSGETSPFSQEELATFLAQMQERGINLDKNDFSSYEKVSNDLFRLLDRINNRENSDDQEILAQQAIDHFIKNMAAMHNAEPKELLSEKNSTARAINKLQIELRSLNISSPQTIDKYIQQIQVALAKYQYNYDDRLLNPDNLFNANSTNEQKTTDKDAQKENQQVFEFKNSLYIFTGLDCRSEGCNVDHLQQFLEQSNIDFQKYSWQQLIFLLESTWNKSSIHLPDNDKRNPLQVENSSLGSFQYDQTKLETLLPIKILLQKIEADYQPADNLNQFLTQIKSKQKFLNNLGAIDHFNASKNDSNIKMFDDGWQEVMFWRQERHNLQELINQLDLQNEASTSLPDLIQIINEIFPNDKHLEELTKKISLFYLQKTDVSLEKKQQFFFDHPELGIEGAETIADQIGSIEAYQNFREKLQDQLSEWQKNKYELTTLANLDTLSSFAAPKFATMFNTAVPNSQIAQEECHDATLVWLATSTDKDYDASTNKFTFRRNSQQENHSETLNDTMNQIREQTEFRSLADTFANYHSLDTAERAVLINKLLNDNQGALTTSENRKELATIIKKIVSEQEKNFTTEMVDALIKTSQPEVISLPLIALLSPLIFHNLQIDKVDFHEMQLAERPKMIANMQKEMDLASTKEVEEELNKEIADLPTPPPTVDNWLYYTLANQENEQLTANINQILHAPTREIVFFGPDYVSNPDSQAAKNAQESDQTYQHILENLAAKTEILLSEGKADKTSERIAASNQQIESIVSGLEAGGATTVRQLQLATQFVEFGPEWSERLSHTLDSNPGLSKLEAWQNLNKWAYENQSRNSAEKQEQLELQNLLQNYYLGKKLGGGSLNSIFELIPKDPKDQRHFVIRLQNPNVASSVKDTHDALATAYDILLTKPEMTKNAQLGSLINDLAQRWCLEDINDPNFINDDLRFREIIANFAPSDERVNLGAPEIGLTQTKIKVEALASGDTLNKLIRRTDIDENTKNILRQTFCDFFLHQLDFDRNHITETNSVTGQTEDFIVVHSDQHLGNYMADIKESGDIDFSVIDRNMYLRLEKDDVDVIKSLLENKGIDFMHKFVRRVLAKNKEVDRGDVNKKARPIENVIMRKLLMSNIKDAFYHQKGSDLEKLQVILQELALRNYDIPLNLQMMIRNVSAYKNIRHDLETSRETNN